MIWTLPVQLAKDSTRFFLFGGSSCKTETFSMTISYDVVCQIKQNNAVMCLLIQYCVLYNVCSVKHVLMDTPASLCPHFLYPLPLTSPAVSQCI